MHGGITQDVDFSADGSVWCSVGWLGDVVVWDGENLSRRLSIDLGEWRAHSVRLHPEGLQTVVLASRKGKIDLLLVDWKRGRTTPLGVGGRGRPLALRWTRDGKSLVWIAARDPVVTLHVARIDVANARMHRLRSIELPDRNLRWIAANGDASEVWVSDLRDGCLGSNRHVHVSLDGATPRLKDCVGVVFAVDGLGKPLLADGGSNRVHGIALTPRQQWSVSRDGRHAVVRAQSTPKTLRLARGGKLETIPMAAPSSWFCGVWIAPGGTIVAADGAGQLHVWDGSNARVVSAHRGVCHRIVFSADSSCIAASGLGALVLAKRDGSVVRRLDGQHLLARCDAGARFALVSADRVRLVDARRKRASSEWALPARTRFDVRSSVFQGRSFGGTFHSDSAIAIDDGARVVIPQCNRPDLVRPCLISRDRVVGVASSRPRSGHRRIQSLLKNPARPQWASLEVESPGCGTCMMSSECFGALRVFDGENELVFDEQLPSRAYAGAYAQDGSSLVVAHGDRIKRYDTATFQVTCTGKPARRVDWLAFLNSDFMVVLTEVGLELWNAKKLERREAIPLRWAVSEIHAIDLAPDGRTLAVGFRDRVFLLAIVD